MITAPCISGNGYLNTRRIMQILSKIILGLTMVDIQIGSIVKAHCPSCGGSRNCRVDWHSLKRTQDGSVTFWTYYFLLVCQGCDQRFMQTVEFNSEAYKYILPPPRASAEPSPSAWLPPSNSPTIMYIPTIKIWSSPYKRQVFEEFIKYEDLINIFCDRSLSSTLRQVYDAYNNNNNSTTMVSMGIRTCFDIASTSLGVDDKLSFVQKLQNLVDRRYITEIEKGYLVVMVDAGNASAHRGWSPNSEQVNILLNILENFIKNTIIRDIDSIILGLQASIIKEKIPPRPSQKKVVSRELSQMLDVMTRHLNERH